MQSNRSLQTASSSAASSAFFYTRKRRSSTPEAPPAPRLTEFDTKNKSTRMKPNRGALPMDLENDAEDEGCIVGTVHEQQTGADNMMLNALISSGVNANTSNYMFYPTAAGSMLMDPSTIMAAALQQMHSYGAYMPATADGSASIGAMEIGATAEQTALAYSGRSLKEVIKTKNCMLFPPNAQAPPPTIRERPPGCRTIFVGGLPEITTEDIIREIFESCGEITTLRMSKKNFCHIRFRHEDSIVRAIYLSGYRLRVSNTNDPANFGRLHVDYAQARDDQYDYECKQRQLQREQRHRDRSSTDHRRSQTPPPIPHYSDHEASLVSEYLRSNDSFVKAVQTISAWLERGDCNKRNANMFYSMIQSTHAHVRRLHTEKQQLAEDLKKARECYRKQMLVMSKQFTQIEKVFNAASHKKVWDHFSKAQRKNIDQWKKLASVLRSVQIEDDEMEMSDDERDNSKRTRYDTDQLKDENDSLRCQLEAMRNEMSMDRTDLKYNSDFREKQIKVLQETIRNMQTQLLQNNTKHEKDSRTIEQLERKLKESAVRQLLLKTRIRVTNEKLKERDGNSANSELSEHLIEDENELKDDSKDDDDTSKMTMNDVNAKMIDANECVESKDDGNNKKKPQLTAAETISNDIIIVDNTNEIVEIDDVDEVHIVEEQESVTKRIEKGKEACNAEGKSYTETISNHQTEVEKVTQTNALLLAEARIVSLVTAFLIVHPLGASGDFICDYLRSFIKPCELNAISLADVLNKYNNVFKAVPSWQHSVDEVVIIWHFCGYSGNTVDGKW